LPPRIDLAAASESWRVEYVASGPAGGLSEEGAAGGGLLRVAATDTVARESLRGWLADSARRVLPLYMERLAAQTGLRPSAVSIRRQKTRWGSCTARRRVNLNCAALFLLPPLVEYLVVHELCHLRHMNHSRRFWALVESFVPDYRDREAALAAAWNSVPGWVFYGP